MFMHGYGGLGTLGMGVGLLFWLALVAGIVVLVVWAVRQAGSRPRDERGPDAVEILRQRYARGELSREQFEQMKRDLGA
jgi:putative membrane protein